MTNLALSDRKQRLTTSVAENAQVVLLPGVSGQRESAYPSTTTDLVKRMRRAGLNVSYAEDRPELKLMADEYWLPVLAFVESVGSNLVAQMVLDIIKGQIGAGWRRVHLHAQIARFRRGDTEVTVADLDGEGEDVIAAIEALFPK